MLNYNDDKNDGDKGCDLNQVELNSITSSFTSLAFNVVVLYLLLAQRFPKYVQPWINANYEHLMKNIQTSLNLNPDEPGVTKNPALTYLPYVIHAAHECYTQRFLPHPTPMRSPIFVQEYVTKTNNQRMLEFRL